MKMRRFTMSAASLAVGMSVLALGLPVTSGIATASAKNQKVLGIVALLANDALNIETVAGATAVAHAAGWQVKEIDTEGSAQKANAAMQTFAAEHVTAMYVLAYAPSSIGQGLAATRAAHIPVAEWGSAPPTNDIVSTVNYQHVAQAEVNALVKAVPAPASILELNFSGGALCVTDGQVYASTVNKASSGYKITSVQIDGANAVQSGQTFTQSWLTTHPAGSGQLAILSSWDVPTTGAIAALEAAGRKDVKVYSINGEAQTLALVQSGKETETTRPSAFLEGKNSMQNILNYLKASSSAKANWKAPAISDPVLAITSANIGAFLKANPGALK
jgi:ribose transport system substrate-binding protein